jgi:hypothetical protein
MKKLIYLSIISLSFTFCKGPGSGPLVKDAFNNKEVEPPSGMTANPMDASKHHGRVITEKTDVKIEPCADCITVAKLAEDKQTYGGKTIKIKGQVTKFNAGIMGKNWVHIQDGSEYKDNFDLTITTDINVAVGQIVTFEGKIALDKDFGYGYAYNILMEEGKLVE